MHFCKKIYHIFQLCHEWRVSFLSKYIVNRLKGIEPFATCYHLYISGNFLMHPKYNHNGMPFSTYDHDADDSPLNCALQYKGGWWYNHCLIANLNGRYLSGHHNSFADGIDVIIWHGTHYSLKTVTMMITKINL